MDQAIVFMTIAGMCAVTYVPRALPMLALASRSMPAIVIRWLSFIPTAVLSALLLPSLVLQEGAVSVSHNEFFWAAIPAFVLAVLTRSFFGTVALGMAVVAGTRFFLM
jgi:branched-subunit amino acid transport protein